MISSNTGLPNLHHTITIKNKDMLFALCQIFMLQYNNKHTSLLHHNQY